LIVAAALLAPAGAAEAGGTTFVVTKTADTADGACNADCSLREAIIAANASIDANTVILSAATYTLTIPGELEDASLTGDLDILTSITLKGPGARTTTIDAGGLDRAIDFYGSCGCDQFALSGVTLTGGWVTLAEVGFLVASGGGFLSANGSASLFDVTIEGNQAAHGGGIYIWSGSGLDLNGVTIRDNQAADGGGVYNSSGTYFENVTISGNTASSKGGGIYVRGSGEISSTTIANNVALSGGGVFVEGSGGSPPQTVEGRVTKTVIAQNFDPLDQVNNCDFEVSLPAIPARFVSTGFNVGEDLSCGFTATGDQGGVAAEFSVLADNGGPTDTHLPVPGNAVIDAATSCPPPATDQRGMPRPQGASCDVGAVEFEDGDQDGIEGGVDNCPTVPFHDPTDSDGDLKPEDCDSPGSGNVDCSGPAVGVTSVDALKVLRFGAGLSVVQSEPCLDLGLPRSLAPPDDWKVGDVNCSGLVNAVDALLILRAVAGLSVALPVGCPEVKPPG
jgi:CSLREA domain-containing protein